MRGASVPGRYSSRCPQESLATRMKKLLLLQPDQQLEAAGLVLAWQSVFGSTLDPATYGVEDVEGVVMLCKHVAWYETVDDIPLVFLRNRAQIDRKLTRLQHSLHHAGSYVTNKEVLDRACQELHTDNWTELAFDNDRPYETMQVINRLQELLHFLIAAYVGVRHFGTIHNLEAYLCKLLPVWSKAEDKRPLVNYDVLYMGPITAHPAVIHYFSLKPSTTSFCKIEPADMARALKCAIECDPRGLHPDTRFTGTQIKEQLEKDHKLNDNQELGVYIDNYAMGYYVRTVQRLMRENSKMENKEMKIINQDAKYKMGNLRRQQNELFAKEVAEWTRNHQMRQLILQQLVRYSTTDSTDVVDIEAPQGCQKLQCRPGLITNSGQLLPQKHMERNSTIFDISKNLVEIAPLKWHDADSSIVSFATEVYLHYSSHPSRLICTQQKTLTGTVDKLHFWHQDLLGSLLMAVLLLYAEGNHDIADTTGRIQHVITLLGNIEVRAAGLNSSFLAVPDVATVSAASGCLCLLWHVLMIAVDCSDRQQHEDALATRLWSAFVLGSQANTPLARHEEPRLRQLWQFWHEDALASSLMHVLQLYARSKLAAVDAWAIKQWLMEQSNQSEEEPKRVGAADFQNAAEEALPSPVESLVIGPQTGQPGGFSNLSGTDQSAITALAMGMECVDGSRGVSLHQVLEVWRTASLNLKVSSPEVKAERLAKLLCFHFRVEDVEHLGHGSFEDIQQAYASHQPSLSPAVLPLLALVPTALQNVSQKLVCDTFAALEQLKSAPVLEDLQEWMQWDVRCKAALGPLRDFLQEHGNASRIEVLEIPNKQLLKVPFNAKVADFKSAMDQGSGHAAAATALGVIVAEGGIGYAPMDLLAQCVQDGLMRLEAQGPLTAAEVVLHALAALPMLVRGVVGMPMFLEPLYMVVGGYEPAQERMVQVCRLLNSSSTVPLLNMLHHLGTELDIAVWQKAALKPGPCTVSAVAQLPEQAVHVVQQPLTPAAQEATLEPTSPDQADITTPNLLHSPSTSLSMTSSNASPSEHYMSPQDHIEHIRQTQFGEGTVLTPQVAGLLGRNMEILSADLYANKAHFVHELVQNADDSSFQPGAIPTAEFVVEDGWISLFVNEDGFTPRDVQALCDIGRSSKKHQDGFIGQKGVGFKSVFSVSDAPQIHSNGFHFNLDVEGLGPIGYFQPTWLEPHARRQVSSGRVLSTATAATQIVLPLRQDMVCEKQGYQLAFREFQPSLLIFTKKLQRLVLTELTGHSPNSIISKTMSDGLVSIRYGTNGQHEQRFLVVKHTHKPLAKRNGMQKATTEVALAFVLDKEQPSQQQAYAYLPVRAYGLNFMIQGDFIVPASRENITDDTGPSGSWNKELRAELPGLFVRSLEDYKRLHTSVADLNGWYQCIPLQGEAQDFFGTMPDSIMKLLRSTECILVEDGSWVCPGAAVICQDKQEAVQQLLSHPALAACSGVRFVNSSLTVFRSKPNLVKQLDIQRLNFQHIVTVLQQVHQKDLFPELGEQWCAQMLACLYDTMAQQKAYTAQDLSYIKLLPMFKFRSGTWQAVESAAGSPHLPLLIRTLQPAAGIRTARLAETAASASKPQSLSDLLRHCQLDIEDMPLRVVADDFVEAAGAEHQQSLLKMMQVLGFSDVTCLHIISEHIMPAFKSPAASALPHATLASYLAFIGSSGLLHTHSQDGQPDSAVGKQLLQNLRQHAVVVTPKWAVRVCEGTPLHFPLGMLQGGRHHPEPMAQLQGSQFDEPMSTKPIDTLIPQHTFSIVSDIYIKDKLMPVKMAHKLLLQLGVTDFVSVAVREMRVTSKNVAQSPWPDLNIEAGHCCTIRDYSGDEFTAIVESVLQAHGSDDETLQNTLRDIFQALDHRFKRDYSHCLHATYTDASGETRQLASSFKQAISQTPWLPSTLGRPATGGSLFHKSAPEARDVFSSHAAYLDVSDVKLSSELLQHLDVKTTVTVAAVIQALKAWSSQAVFETNLQHMSCVYEFLSKMMDRNSGIDAHTVRSAFMDDDLIWLPLKQEGHLNPSQPETAEQPASCSHTTTGMFYGVKDSLSYHDPEQLIEGADTSAMRSLHASYPSRMLQKFFCQQLQPQPSAQHATQHAPQLLVKDTPTTEDYIALLKSVATQQHPTAFEQAHQLLLHWSVCFNSGQLQDVHLIQQEVKTLPLLPVEVAGAYRWACSREVIYLNDDPGAAMHFQTGSGCTAEVAFLTLPLAGLSSRSEVATVWQSLHQILGLPLLTESLQKRPISSGLTLNLRRCQCIVAAIPYLQRFLKTNWADDYDAICQKIKPYLSLTPDGSQEAFNFMCAGTLKLDVAYTLCASNHSALVTDEKAMLYTQQSSTSSSMLWLYLGDQSALSLRTAFEQLSIFFVGKSDVDVCNFLQDVYDAQDSAEDIESITSTLKEVPADEVRWEVHTGLSPEQWAEGADSSSPPKAEGDLNAEPAREWLRQHARRPQTPDNKEPVELRAAQQDGHSPKPETLQVPLQLTRESIADGGRSHSDSRLTSGQSRNTRNVSEGLPFTALDISAATAAGAVRDITHLMPQVPAFSLADMPDIGLNEDHEDNIAVGEWCEKYVYDYLRSEAGTGPGADNVVWVNEGEESGNPFDIFTGPDSNHHSTRYVEVKGTGAESKPFFEISVAELSKAAECKDRYSIYRVSGIKSRSGPPKVVVIDDPVGKIKSGLLMSCLVVKQELR